MNYLIKNATIVDGTGQNPFQGDVLIEKGLIKGIGDLKESGNFDVIDGKDLVIAPGFIDVDSHSDVYWSLFDYPRQESFLTQGITTIIGGNCGTSLAPIINEESIKSFQKYTDPNKTLVNWVSYAEYLEELKKKGLGLNFGGLVGHITLRRAFLGDDMRPATQEEIRLMAGSLDRALDEGALGLSLGLTYTHAQSATKEELLALAHVVKQHKGVLAIHLRNERDGFLEALNEAISIAKETGVSLQISHLKVLGEKNWPQMETALSLIDQAHEDGLDINFDICPYSQSGPVLYTLLPKHATEGGKKSLLKRLKNPQTRMEIIDSMHQSGIDFGEIIVATSKIGKSLNRRKIKEIAQNQDRTPEEVVLDLLIASDDRITSIIELVDFKNVIRGALSDLSMIATNGFALNVEHEESGDFVHPRCFGALPKFLSRFVNEDQSLTMAQAIKKITLLPAQKFHLDKEVGSIEKGKRADLVVFNAANIKDKATTDNPFAYSEGIEYVFLSGELAYDHGEFKNEKKGRILEPKRGMFS